MGFEARPDESQRAMFVNNLRANQTLTQLLLQMSKDTHMLLNKQAPGRTRKCHYCGCEAPTAFYLNALRAYSCVACYVAQYVPKHGGQKVAGAA